MLIFDPFSRFFFFFYLVAVKKSYERLFLLILVYCVCLLLCSGRFGSMDYFTYANIRRERISFESPFNVYRVSPPLVEQETGVDPFKFIIKKRSAQSCFFGITLFILIIFFFQTYLRMSLVGMWVRSATNRFFGMVFLEITWIIFSIFRHQSRASCLFFCSWEHHWWHKNVLDPRWHHVNRV